MLPSPGGESSSPSRRRRNQPSEEKEEDWTQVQDPVGRRRLQNRMAQRRHRDRTYSRSQKSGTHSGTSFMPAEANQFVAPGWNLAPGQASSRTMPIPQPSSTTPVEQIESSGQFDWPATFLTNPDIATHQPIWDNAPDFFATYEQHQPAFEHLPRQSNEYTGSSSNTPISAVTRNRSESDSSAIIQRSLTSDEQPVCFYPSSAGRSRNSNKSASRAGRGIDSPGLDSNLSTMPTCGSGYDSLVQPSQNKEQGVHRQSSESHNRTSPLASGKLEKNSLETRLQYLISCAESAGFDSIDSALRQYYTKDLDNEPQIADTQRWSRKRYLGSLLSEIYESSKDWSDWEAQGYREAILLSAENILSKEFDTFRRLVKAGSSINNNTHDVLTASNLLRGRKLLRPENQLIRDKLPNTWSLFTELARGSEPSKDHAQGTSEHVLSAITTLIQGEVKKTTHIAD